MTRRTSAAILGLTALFSTAFAQNVSFLKINPRATYLRDSEWEPGATSLFIDLSAEDLVKRDAMSLVKLEIHTVGWYNRAGDNPASHNISNQAVAVFSEDGSLDSDWSHQFRVGAPIDALNDFYTLPTWVGNHPTDIPDDFGLGSDWMSLVIPAHANYLMFTTYDNGFWNNTDDFSMPGADPRGFGVEWRVVSLQSVPEPISLLVLGLGSAALLRRKR